MNKYNYNMENWRYSQLGPSQNTVNKQRKKRQKTFKTFDAIDQ